MKKLTLTLSALLIAFVSFCQENTSILMSIDGRDITSEEFIRVYSKNNNITPQTEKKSIDEYLDLFINFKLKVIEAENSGYDTVKSFISELEGYKGQLAKPYIQSSNIKTKLIDEAYYRTINEVKASHIMVRLAATAAPADTLKAYNKILEIRKRVLSGEPFEKVARESSEDPSAVNNSGDLGYFSAFRMVYPFETAAYSTAVGSVSMPIRTQFGYHLVKVTDFRPSKGSVKVSHIMTRFDPEASAPEKQAAKEKIEKALEELKSGAEWNVVVQNYSENPSTKKFNGEIGWLKTGQAPEHFMEICYKLEPGQFSEIVETTGGFHIARIIEKKPVETFDEVKEQITKKIDTDIERINAIQEIVNSSIKNKYGFEQTESNASALVNLLDSSIYKRNWNADVAKDLTAPIYKVGNKVFTQYDYAKFLAKSERSKIGKSSFEQIVEKNLGDFTNECLMGYAVEKLPEENLDYKYLYKEYHDGILLFNLTNDLIWKRAQEDTVGLEAFYKTAKKYNWNPRIDVLIYEYSDSNLTTKIPAVAKKQVKGNKGEDFVLSALCPNDTIPCVKIKTKFYEKDVDALSAKLSWKKGGFTSLKENNKFYFYYTKNTLEAGPKQLYEARGLYIADYQNLLEEQWIAQLRSKYKITINDTVLNDLKANLNK